MYIPQDCPLCSNTGYAMGALGNRVHYRCGSCGGQFSHQASDVEFEDEEDEDDPEQQEWVISGRDATSPWYVP